MRCLKVLALFLVLGGLLSLSPVGDEATTCHGALAHVRCRLCIP